MTEIWDKFFLNYHDVFWLVYGLVFYSMGLSIVLHSRQYSRLVIAKSLPWLGAFGIVHGLFEWGHIIIPIQIKVGGAQYTTVLTIVHQILLAVVFFLLFQFGIELFRPFKPSWIWVRYLPIIIFIAWLVGPFMIGFSLISGVEEWSAFADATARYFICLPASVISVMGLIHQQRLQIKPMKLPIIDNMIRFAAGALAAYALFAGLIVPKTFFFPATIINYDTFSSLVFAPPYFVRALIGLSLLYSIVRALEVFNYETDDLIRNMEEVQVIANEREHIARDLHDGTLQQVYAAGLLAQSLKKHVPEKQKPEVDILIGTINHAIDQLRAFLPQQKTDLKTVDLIGALSPKIEEARRYFQVETNWDSKLPSLSVEQTRHIAAILSEAISNAIRHAKSEMINVSLKYEQNHLVLIVRDFGAGISLNAEQGFGLRNMRDRARMLGAELAIRSENSKGTLVKLDMPLEDLTNEH